MISRLSRRNADKEHFINDRRRDRALKFGGYDVLRFSGSEIYADAISASKEFHDHLMLTISQLQPALEEVKRPLSDPEVAVMLVAVRAVIVAAEETRLRLAESLQPAERLLLA